jgi:hypothetical protein
MGSYGLIGTVLGLQVEIVLEMDDGDGYTAISMYFRSLN